MAAYCRVYDSRHLQADCQEPGSNSARKSGVITVFLLIMLCLRGTLSNAVIRPSFQCPSLKNDAF